MTNTNCKASAIFVFVTQKTKYILPQQICISPCTFKTQKDVLSNAPEIKNPEGLHSQLPFPLKLQSARGCCAASKQDLDLSQLDMKVLINLLHALCYILSPKQIKII